MGRIVKLLVVAAILFAAWKYVVPWVKGQAGKTGTESTASSPGSSCVQRAEQASEKWGSGLHQFANPPYDLNAWATFRSDVESNINAAETECDCAGESCEKVRGALRDLRALVNDLDSTLRNGSDASDFVQRQERIDNAINEAADLARDGN
jgi:hypothetical protein